MIDHLMAVEVMQHPVVVPSVRAFARDDRRLAELRAQPTVSHRFGLQAAPRTHHGSRGEHKVNPRVLSAPALNREFACVWRHRDPRHECRDGIQIDPANSLWLDLKTESLHKGDRQIRRPGMNSPHGRMLLPVANERSTQQYLALGEIAQTLFRPSSDS